MKGKHLSYHIDSHTNEKMPLVNIAEELATNILPASLLVVEDTRRGGLYEWFKREGKNNSQNPYNPKITGKNAYEDDDSEPTRREEQVDPGLNLGDLHIETGRDDTSLV